jgi:glycosyltransferase involved in cell wall biosynthesis
MRRGEWIDSLMAATGKQQLTSSERLFAEVIRIQVNGDWNAAAEKGRDIDKIRPGYFAVYAQESFSWLCAGYPEKAQLTLDRFPRPVEHERLSPITWLACFISLRCGDHAVACELYLIYTGLVETSVLKLCPSEADLLRIWDGPRPLSSPHPAYYYPTLPPSLTGFNQIITRAPQNRSVLTADLPSVIKKNPKTSELPPIVEAVIHTHEGILSIASEWFSRHGGVSTFNRELCCSLARIGQRVVCLVPAASDYEKKAAGEFGVTLITAASTSVPETAAALLRKPQLPEGFVPKIIIGHGRITGPFAEAQVADNFKEARRVHFVHTIPGEIEWYKDNDDPASSAEERERLELNLCRNASLVAAVGPRIARETATLVHGLDTHPKVHCFYPGIDNVSDANVMPPPGIQCLLLGRAEDLQLKGLDIAAKAMAELPHPSPRPFESAPALIVRGAPKGTGSDLRNKLIDIAEKQIDVRVREFTSDIGSIKEDLCRASVVLMPSRAEGFGLVASEALGFGIPILVSDRSGFGELLRENLPESKAVQYVIRTTGDLRTDAPEWSRALEVLLRDREAAFRRAQELRNELSVTLSWDSAASELLSACG